MQTRGWQEVIKPWLEVKLNQSFPDPSQFISDKEFTYAAKVTSVFKKVIAEILMFIEQQDMAAKHLRAKQKGEDINKFKIGE